MTAALIVRKSIRASPERIFDAWTQPEHLKLWWGPKSVECIDAEVDLRVGGRYRIANQFPDGKVLWISGEFETIERPHRLVYTWRVGPEAAPERVTVTFEARGEQTEVIVMHERIPTQAMSDMHEQGWVGCLDGLVDYLEGARG
ncbi:MAG TPA: SRPBCC domain-containing protein [Steroidobacteraceae bacterium]|nr:SRPBCC domain-containing protein [Steroidobacteraceae bacterium]